MFESRSAAGQGHVVRRRLQMGLGAVGFGALLLSAWFVLAARDSERALPGVHVEGQDVSRLTRAEIEARVQAWAAQRATRKIALSLAGTALILDPQALGFKVDSAASAARALAVGRAGGVFSRGFAFFPAHGAGGVGSGRALARAEAAE